MPKKIAIIGAAPTKSAAPISDLSWEVWACSPRNQDLPRFDAWFELHKPELYWPVVPEYMEWLKALPAVYMLDQYPDFPGSIKYPLVEMIEQSGRFFFTSTIAYMLALAISKEPETIGLFGVEMNVEGEFQQQRPGCHHFIQIALHLGINIVTPKDSVILHPPGLYGYQPEYYEPTPQQN